MMRCVRNLLLLLLLSLAAPGFVLVAPGVVEAQESEIPDYAAWEKDAVNAEEVIIAGRASSTAMEEMRARIAVWRAKFDVARTINSAQIETMKSQIAALGAVPADGAAEAPEIARRRRELNELLSRQQAPGLAAVEAFSRADGIIRQIDALIRERQADALLRLLPSPANPLHWPSAAAVLSQGVKTLWAEVDQARNNPSRRTRLSDNLPLIVVCLLLAALLMLRGPGFMEKLSRRLQTRAALRARAMVAAFVSLGQVVVPVIGMVLLVTAVLVSGITGPRLEALVRALPSAALSFFAARWLASWLFQTDNPVEGMRLTDRPAEARLHVTLIGMMVAFEAFRSAFTTEVRPPLSQAAQAVWLAPAVCVVAVFLFRLGMLLRRQQLSDAPSLGGEALFFRNRMISLVGTAMAGVAMIAPLLALIGYVAAANALIWPTIGSAALIGMIILLLRFLTDIYVIVTKSGEEGREALIPVLIGFLLHIGALPLLALIWGARTADLTEIWARFQSGVALGDTRISPTAILTLFVVFGFGYMLTRLLQGAMRASVLPRTKLDKGAQNAAVAGLGYLGLFLSALVAVTTAGIDLSSLAIVAGALSVGIGFGLQNIVQNFIAGIILLVERPISEGDTIEVGNKVGTVQSISVRSTRILTADQSEVVVPNAEFISGIVTNWTRDNLHARLFLPVRVAYGSDTRKVEALLRSIVEAQPMVLIEPAPSVHLVGMGLDGLNYEVRAILSDLNFKLDVQSEVYHQIVARFADEGIEIPFAQKEVWFTNRDDMGTAGPKAAKPVGKAKTAEPTLVALAPKPTAINNDPDEGLGDRR